MTLPARMVSRWMPRKKPPAVKAAVEDALRKGANLAGQLGGDAPRYLGEMLDPQVRWEDQMGDFIESVKEGDENATWYPPYRRFLGYDMYMPTSYNETMGELVTAVDVSGSISEEQMTYLISEIKEICKTVKSGCA